MRGESHRQLGIFLAEHYLADASRLSIRAFLLGCIEPDRNPVTYLKGSLRHQWLRGHNYRNASHFLQRISRRLERKEHWTFLDYYTLGKLIHYTTDAFTYAHNDTFPTQLSDHMAYEHTLQEHFLTYLQDMNPIQESIRDTVMETIRAFHVSYEKQQPGVHTDSCFALVTCCCVLSILV